MHFSVSALKNGFIKCEKVRCALIYGSEVFLPCIQRRRPTRRRFVTSRLRCFAPIGIYLSAIAVGRGTTDFSLDINAPVSAIRAKAGPTARRRPWPGRGVLSGGRKSPVNQLPEPGGRFTRQGARHSSTVAYGTSLTPPFEGNGVVAVVIARRVTRRRQRTAHHLRWGLR